MASRGLLLGGLSSMSGKTLITLGLMRALREAGHDIAAAKAGPDYIDPGFHARALGRPSINLDPFAMSDNCLAALARTATAGEVLITEGVMGVHDGGGASSAHLARALGIPVILVIDIRGLAETAGAIAKGIEKSLNDMDAHLGGVILNRARSPRHGALACGAVTEQGIAVLGTVMESDAARIPSRHLGLVQAIELTDAENMIDEAAGLCTDGIDLEAVLRLATPIASASGDNAAIIPPPGERIAIARDNAFGFLYTHLLDWWGDATIIPFSPLANEAPDENADFIFLPGGYPELHLERLSAARNFHEGLQAAARKGIKIYGECGGYMVLGQSIMAKNGIEYPMAGLLGLKTDFSRPQRHLGYRYMNRIGDAPLPISLRGHEFHYTTAIMENGAPLFEVADKDSASLGKAGLVDGNVSGSYLHMIAAG